MALLFIDLDRFKDINDSFGHSVGDALLVAVGLRILADLRPGEHPRAQSGDEFVVLCEELQDEQQALHIAERIVAAVSRPFLLSDREVTVSASVGVAFAGAGS